MELPCVVVPLAGSLTIQFPKSGTYFFAGDPVGSKVVMTGQVNVRQPGQGAHKVTVTLGGYEAQYKPSGASK